MRGSRTEEKVLKNAKDTCATEALEIATYVAIEHLARAVGDETTATLAASIRGDEERMLERVMRAIPKLAEAVADVEVKGKQSDDATTGAAQAVTEAGSVAQRAASKVAEEDLAIARYDQLTAEEIIEKLRGLSQIELAKTEAYERQHDNRSTVLNRISSLRGDETWPGCDELTVAEVQAVLSEADEQRIKDVRTYERSRKNRTGVLNAAHSEPATR
jgi:hypothetical protein